MMQVETKFNVLNEELSLQYDRNPIETIKTRLKTPESIANKLIKKQVPLTAESIEENISDVAGVRVICSFQSDIYMLADALLKQDDITLLKRKDYIAHPNKKDVVITPEIEKELRECAEISDVLDRRMEMIQQKVENEQN